MIKEVKSASGGFVLVCAVLLEELLSKRIDTA
jgi:hypothetical protein